MPTQEFEGSESLMVSINNYATLAEIRTLSGLTTSDISNDDLTTILGFATTKLNKDINVRVIRERIAGLDNTRRNLINNSNCVYYVKNWRDYYLGDLNNDGVVDTSDVIVYAVSGDGTETTPTIASVTPNSGKFTLQTAQSGVTMYVTYSMALVDEYTPSEDITLAVSYLCGAMSYLKIDARKIANFSVGKVRVGAQSDAYNTFMDKYLNIINSIKDKPLKKGIGVEIYKQKLEL